MGETTIDPLDGVVIPPKAIITEVGRLTREIWGTVEHLDALYRESARWYRLGQQRGMTLGRLGEIAGCSGEAVGAALEREEQRRA